MDNQETTPDAPAHTPGTNKGEELSEKQGKEAGRHDTSAEDAERLTGTATARNSTSINAEHEDPIDPQMPNMPPA